MRLFIAFPLDKPVSDRLGEMVGEFRRRGGPIKWVEPHNMHLTARFLGETPESLVSQIVQIVDRAASHAAVVQSVIHQIGGFPNLHRPRVIWVGLDKEAARLIPIAEQIELAVQKLGFEPEKKGFKPHLTLGRIREGQKIGNALDYLLHHQFEPIPAKFDRLALIQSTLTPTGPVYKTLHEARLTGAQ